MYEFDAGQAMGIILLRLIVIKIHVTPKYLATHTYESVTHRAIGHDK